LYEQLVNYSDLQTRHGHQQLNRVSRAASVIATLTSSENNSLVKTNLGCTHRRLVNARILASARKHGIADEDILHAFRNAILDVTDDDIVMLIGPNRHGNLIEIALIRSENGFLIIHVMQARKKYLK
jgi:hypothetical protein